MFQEYILVTQARILCNALQDILRRMDLQENDPDAYNDKWRDQVERVLGKAYRRYERRMRRMAREYQAFF